MSRTRTLTAALALALAACVAGPPAQVAAFRPAGAGLWSAAAFQPARLQGRWQQVAAYSTTGTPGCRAGAVDFAAGTGGLTMAARLCLNGRELRTAGPVKVVGPGRLAVPGMKDWWVIWVDSGYRTLAIATPDGTFGFVLDRAAIPPDRLAAAAEIFAFNGYSPARLRPF